MIVNKESRVTEALTYLAETDEAYAKAKARVKALEQKRKTAKATAFLAADGTMAEREQKAYASQTFKDITAEIEDAVYDEQILANKRTLEQLVIDVWRSENANRRAGNV